METILSSVTNLKTKIFSLTKLISIFFKSIKSELTSYAAPLFVRLRKEMETTGTFKYRKVDLVKEGIDIKVVKDPLFIRDDVQKTFVPLTQERYSALGVTAKL